MPIAEDGSYVPDSFYNTPESEKAPAQIGRRLAEVARRFAAQANEALAAAPQSKRVKAKIAGVAPGAGSDGNALVTVLWRGSLVVANGYNRSYTPVVGHRVVCDYIDNELTIDYSPVGFP